MNGLAMFIFMLILKCISCAQNILWKEKALNYCSANIHYFHAEDHLRFHSRTGKFSTSATEHLENIVNIAKKDLTE